MRQLINSPSKISVQTIVPASNVGPVAAVRFAIILDLDLSADVELSIGASGHAR